MNKKKNYIIIDTSAHDQKEYVEIKFSFDKATMRNPEVFNRGICSSIKSLDDILYLDQKHGLQSICKKVIKSFEQLYNIDLSEIEIFSKYTSYEVNAVYKSGKRQEIIIDPMLFDAIHAFFVVSFIWEDFLFHYETEKTIGNTKSIKNDYYFKYMTTIFYALIKDENICNIYKFKHIKEYYDKIGENSLFNLIVSCQYCATYFCVAHECAHAYFDIKGIEFSSNVNFSAEEYKEFEADKLAFNLILKMIQDEQSSDISDTDKEIYNYSYMAPMMLMEFYYLYMIINQKLNNKNDIEDLIKNVQNRGNKLLDTYYQSIKPYGLEFDSALGESVYQANQNVMALYCEMFKEYSLNGKLKNLFTVLENC